MKMISNTKTLIGAALLLSGSIAIADDPMVLSSSQMDSVTAGGGVHFNSNRNDRFNVDRNIYESKYADYHVSTHVTNNSAAADATADAFGRNTDAQTFTYGQTTNHSSEAASTSIALTGSNGCC